MIAPQAAEVPAPRWGADRPSFAGAEPAEADQAPARSARTWDEDDLDDVRDKVRKRHPYTWLHLTVLAIVAFVLGFLIMLLANKGTSTEGTATSGPSGATLATLTLASGPDSPDSNDVASST